MTDKEESMRFPADINPATGRFEMVSGKEKIRQSVILILNTAKGERWLNPQFGSSLKSYGFMEMNQTELNIMERDIRRSLLTLEPLLKEVRVETECDYNNGILEVTVAYSTKDLEDTVTVPLYTQHMENIPGGGRNERNF